MKLSIGRTTRLHGQTAILLSPWMITFLVFWLFPLIYALYMSFTRYLTLRNEAEWIGFDNYVRIFNDDLFWTALANTSIFVVGTIPFTTALALGLALAVHRVKKFRNFFRSAFFLPSVSSLVVLSLIFTNLYAKDGYINYLLQMLGLDYPERGWLLEPSTALFAVMGMEVWISAGYYMVIFLAALQTIPKDYYEAAELAGANLWTQLTRITIPLLRPTLLFVLVINTIKSFQVFVEIYVMTKGGPLHATTTLIYQVFINAFEKADMMGYAAALAYVVFIIILLFSLLQIKILRIDRGTGE